MRILLRSVGEGNESFCIRAWKPLPNTCVLKLKPIVIRSGPKQTISDNDDWFNFIRYGLLGKKFKDTFGHVGGAILGGLVGLKKPDNHGVPYSLTEEFASVYRMHSLLPDDFHCRDVSVEPDHNKSPPLIETYLLSLSLSSY